MSVRAWKAIFSVLCLAIWLPATQHCKLETLPGLAFLHCPTDTPTNSDCDGDFCKSVESGMYKPSDNQSVSVESVALVIAYVQPVIEEAVADSFKIPTTVPPDLPTSWQFIARTALPVRAPSFAS